ncbi:MAG: hypothetical protein R6W71_06945 [Bacteroidales bacterium]
MKKKTVSKAARMIYNARLKKGYTQLDLVEGCWGIIMSISSQHTYAPFYARQEQIWQYLAFKKPENLGNVVAGKCKNRGDL